LEDIMYETAIKANTAVVSIDELRCFYLAEGPWERVPGFGELGFAGAEETIDPANMVHAAAQQAGLYRALTREAHPDPYKPPFERTAHFAPVGEQPNFVNNWTEHGIDGSDGAKSHPNSYTALFPDEYDEFIKGDVVAATPEDDTSYTGWLAHDRVTGEMLPARLRRLGKQNLILVGVALGDGDENMLCMDYSATDFNRDGFDVTVVTDATEAILPENRDKCLRNLGAKGVRLATAAEIVTVINGLR
jgi:nicotinamidase/pyrazinamidase